MEPHLDSQEEKGSGHWSVVNLPRWIRLSFPRHTITKPEKLFFRATATNWEAFWAFSFASTPPLRRDALGLRVLLSDFTNVCNIPYNVYTGQSTEMKLIELSLLHTPCFPRTSPWDGVWVAGCIWTQGLPATHVLLSRVSKWFQNTATRRSPAYFFWTLQIFNIPGIFHIVLIMFWKNTQSYVDLCIV